MNKDQLKEWVITHFEGIKIKITNGSKEHRLQYNSPNLNKVRPLIDEILTNKKVSNSYREYTDTLMFATYN